MERGELTLLERNGHANFEAEEPVARGETRPGTMPAGCGATSTLKPLEFAPRSVGEVLDEVGEMEIESPLGATAPLSPPPIMVLVPIVELSPTATLRPRPIVATPLLPLPSSLPPLPPLLLPPPPPPK